MKAPRGRRYTVVAWAVTGALLAGGVFLAVKAWEVQSAFHVRAALPLRPDGVAVSTPTMGSSSRFDYRVLVRGTFRGTYNGAVYDATQVAWQDEDPRPHEALEIRPASVREQTESETGHTRIFVPGDGMDMEDRRITLRLRSDYLEQSMYLPESETGPRFTGELWMEVWQRDREVQGREAGAVAVCALLLLGAGGTRLWAHRRRRARQLVAARGSEVGLLMRRLRRHRDAALKALDAAGLHTSPLRPHVEALAALAEEHAVVAEAFSRSLRGTSRRLLRTEPPSPQVAAAARAGYEEQLRQLCEIESAVAGLPARVLEATTYGSAQALELRAVLDAELNLVRESTALVRAGRLP